MSYREVFIGARQARGWTQEHLAQLVGVDTHWVSNREQGKARITLEDGAKMARALELTDEEWAALRELA